MSSKIFENLKILLVEDSPTQLLSLKETLGGLGAEIIEAINGVDGFQKASNHRPSIVITDIQMPEMNGYELCRKIKDDNELADTPIILLTSLKDPMDVIKGIECGADNFLTKPCSEELLASSIEDAIENYRLTKKSETSPELEFSYHGKRHKIRVNQNQITELLLSTYANAIEKNREFEKTNRKLGALHVELQKKNEELIKLINEKNLLLGMAAHDLRNPLHAIQGYSEILEMKLSENADEKISRMIATIKRQSKFMLDLVNDLLNISVIDLGKLKLNLQKVDPTQLVINTCKVNENIAEQKEISISLSYDDGIPEMMIDTNKIEQVLNNLISNAIKYSHPKSKIEVSLRSDNNGIALSVKDQGVGIPDDYTEHLFEMITKKRSEGTEGEPSTGLGLAIAKRIVVEHKGKIWVESSLGLGSTFHVTLPRIRSPEEFHVNAEQDDAVTSSKNEK